MGWWPLRGSQGSNVAMADDPFVLRRVAWQDLCPWLKIFRCFRLAISLPLLSLATLGALLSPLGSEVSEWLFSRNANAAPWVSSTDETLRLFPPIPVSSPGVIVTSGFPLHAMQDAAFDREGSSGVFHFFVDPVWSLFNRQASTSSFLGNLLVALWNIGIWSLLGGAISRVAAVHLGRDERLSTTDALKHAATNW